MVAGPCNQPSRYTTLHGRPPAERRWRGSFKLHPSERAFDNPDSRTAWVITRAPGQARASLCVFRPRNYRPFAAGPRPRTFHPLPRPDAGHQPTDMSEELMRVAAGETRWHTRARRV